MLDGLTLALACPACAAGDYGDGPLRELLLGAMIAGPILVAAILIPTIVRIVKRGGR
jgi:hypothetical protein